MRSGGWPYQYASIHTHVWAHTHKRTWLPQFVFPSDWSRHGRHQQVRYAGPRLSDLEPPSPVDPTPPAEHCENLCKQKTIAQPETTKKTNTTITVLELGRLFPKFCLLCMLLWFLNNYLLNFQNSLVTEPAKNNFATSSSWDLSSNFGPILFPILPTM